MKKLYILTFLQKRDVTLHPSLQVTATVLQRALLVILNLYSICILQKGEFMFKDVSNI